MSGRNVRDQDAMRHSLKQFEFNIKTKKLSLVHHNIHQKWNHQDRKLKIDDLKIGDYVDVRDDLDHWYLAKILDIKDKVYYTSNNNNNNDFAKHVRSMKILIHYLQWESSYDEWIQVTNDHASILIADLSSILDHLREQLKATKLKTADKDSNKVEIDDEIQSIIDKMKNSSSICDCSEQCCHSDDKHPMRMLGIHKTLSQCHRIALPKTQSMYTRSLENFRVLYSKKNNTMILCGRNRLLDKRARFGGVYCKRVNYHDKKYFQLLIDAIVRPFRKELFLNIPKELCQLILKYYVMQSDKCWQHMMKKDINGDLIKSTHDTSFDVFPMCCLVDDTNMHIYMFAEKNPDYRHQGSAIRRLDIDIQTQSYKITKLHVIKSPQIDNQCNCWHAVFCQKSKTVHLFDQLFDKHFSIQIQDLR